jgi:hypothetical protein
VIMIILFVFFRLTGVATDPIPVYTPAPLWRPKGTTTSITGVPFRNS